MKHLFPKKNLPSGKQGVFDLHSINRQHLFLALLNPEKFMAITSAKMVPNPHKNLSGPN